MVKIPEDRQNFGRFEWERVLRRADLPYTVKCMGLMIATYASADGGDMFPGRERLAAEAGLSPRQVSRHLDALRDAKLLTVTRMHNRQAGRADEYALTVPLDPIALNLLDPEELTRPGDYVTSVSALGDTSDALRDTDDVTRGHERHPTTSVPLMDKPNINHASSSPSVTHAHVREDNDRDGLMIHLPTTEPNKDERYALAYRYLTTEYRGDMHTAVAECQAACDHPSTTDAVIHVVEQVAPHIFAANAA
ncbi:hypothetical protein [Isoptericola sp. NPDC060257]|uniref:hypothetical protein n=1 Tax=Isoptericola sp. NPDC060257 TaxID=3347087 RepID=UPI00365307AF